jgi:type VI secretion system secreted protein VgrG
MGLYTQANRPMAVATPLGPDALLLERLAGTEGLSELFQYDLDLLAEPDTPVDFADLIGQPVTVTLRPRDGTPRFVHGLVCRFGRAGTVRGQAGGLTFTRYTAAVVPDLWKLTKTHRSRIFQQVAVPDILRTVFQGLATDFRLSGTYEPRDYCAQYKETDFAFASRLMEEEGIFYYFTHADGAHTLVLGDDPAAHDPIPGVTELIFDDVTGGGQNAPEDRIRGWSKTQELTSGKVTLWDHSFELPPQNLEADGTIVGSVSVGAVSHRLAVGGNDAFEVYDYPGRYAQRFDGIDPSGGERPDDVQKIFQDNRRTAGLRMQQLAAAAVAVTAEGTVRTITAGHTFSVVRTDDGAGDGEYVVRRVTITADLSASYHHGRDGGAEFRNVFEVLPAGLPFRPPAVTPKGRIHGVQAGTVVGPAGEEIFTDKYGRVKVQFRWDRDGALDAGSSCWVRVGSMWAGKQWGMVHIPRIGQEVLIAFEEGDPDRPIVVGSVYNAEQMPPYTLPDNRTQSGVKSRSSLDGTPDNFNELRFEDKLGQEQVYFHAEKDFDQVVENNMTLKVGFREGGNDPEEGDQTVEIHNNQSTVIGKPHASAGPPPDGSQTFAVWNNQTVTIGAGKAQAADGSQTVGIWNSQNLTVGQGKAQAGEGNQVVSVWNNQNLVVGAGKGMNPDGSQTTTIWKDRTTTLKMGDDTLTLDMGNQTERLKLGNRAVTLDLGNDTLTLKLGNRTTKLSLGADKTEALQSITLKVGASKVVVDQMGVTIEGMMVKINGQVMCDVKGLMTTVTGTAMMKVGGGITMIG